MLFIASPGETHRFRSHWSSLLGANPVETLLQQLLIVLGDANHVGKIGVVVQLQYCFSRVRETIAVFKAEAVRTVLIKDQFREAGP